MIPVQRFRSSPALLRSNPRRGALALLLALLLGACGQSPSIVLVLDAATAEVLRGSDVEIEVTLTRAGGASADVTLSITGLPANVTAQFTPPTLSGGTLNSTLVITATAGAVAGSYDVTVTGTGTGLADSADLTLDVVGLTVTGRVVSLLELPVVGASIRSQNDSAITDADGSFTLTGLSVPYDLSVWNQAESWVQIYEGLTAADPLIAPLRLTPPSVTGRSSNLSGTLSGGVIPVGANQVVLVCAEGIDGVAVGCDTVAPTESAYAFSVDWFGEATRAVRIHALQFQRDVAGYPTSYLGYVTTDLTLTDTIAAVANLDLGAAIGTTTVDVDIVSPVPVIATLASVQVGPNLTMPVAQLSSAATSHAIMMPVIDDASYSFAAAVSINQFGWQSDVTGTTASVTVGATPQLVAPADLATGVTEATTFSAADPDGGPLTFMWYETIGDLEVSVTTMDTSRTMPNLTPYGLALPANTDFNWQVFGHSGDSVDDAADALVDYYGFVLMLTQASPGMSGAGSFALSNPRGFTTAP